MTIPASALATAVEIEADRFQNLKYDEPSFQKEARAVLGEYNKSSSSPFLKLEEAMQNTAYTRHTYKHTTIGFLADIKDMPNQYAYSKIFFDRWYRPENCTIIVTGDVKHDELVSLVRSHYGAWPRGKATVEIPAEPAQTEPRSAHLTWPVPTLPTLYLGYHIPAADPSNPDVAALGALEQAVFGETSPLYRELVLKEQKVVTLMADASAPPRSRPVLDPRPGPEARGPARCPEADRRGLGRRRQDPDRRRHGWTRVQSHLRYAFAASLRSRRRRGPHRRRVDRDRPAGPMPMNELFDDLRAAHSRRPPARRRPVFQPHQRDGDHPRDGEEEMTRNHRLAIGLCTRLACSAGLAVLARVRTRQAERRAAGRRSCCRPRPAPSSPSGSSSGSARRTTPRARKAWPP